MKTCHSCKKALDVGEKVGRAETCPFCHADLHCCLNCRFYGPGNYNQCRENQAERVLDKDRSNFCDYFSFKDAAGAAGDKNRDKKVTNPLNALFKK